MIALLVRLFLAIAAMLLALPASAQLGSGAEHLHPRLIAESTTVVPGRPTTLAIAMTPERGWHGYWQNPGDAGTETQAAWTLPKGVTAGPLLYPVPTALMISGLMNYVYEAPYALLVTLEVPASVGLGVTLPVSAKLDYLACTNEICVPQSSIVSTTLVTGPAAGHDLGDFARWRAALPRPLGAEASFSRAGKALRLGIPLPATSAVEEPYFFPLGDGAIDYAAPQRVTRNGDTLVLETIAGEGAPAGPLAGVLRIGAGRGLSVSAEPGAVPPAGEPIGAAATPAGGGATTFLLAFAGAVLGGLLLNVMPCVFPILSLKALGLARAGGDERTARREAIAYAGGVIAVCLALGALLLGLRAAGHTVGWAFQLQDPRVIGLLLLLVTGIALNLAGLFELGAVSAGGWLADRGGVGGAFWTGALAAFVATPCTGPFMGAALGAALVLPAWSALAVFGGLGIGLALPFLAIGFSARLRALLPRPGAWMERLRHILAIPMLITALGLAWVLGRQTGADGMATGLAAALLLAIGLWWLGARQRRGGERPWIGALPFVIVAVLLALVVPRVTTAALPQPEAAALGAQPFTEARLASLRAEGRPVFLYFTADWCLTCKVNEKAAIERAPVADAFRRGNVATLIGDWTDGDAAIGRFLEAHGRSGVPLYLYYPPGGEPRVLPQLLTPGTLIALAG